MRKWGATIIKDLVGEYLTDGEIHVVLARQDLIMKEIEKLIQKKSPEAIKAERDMRIRGQHHQAGARGPGPVWPLYYRSSADWEIRKDPKLPSTGS